MATGSVVLAFHLPLVFLNFDLVGLVELNETMFTVTDDKLESQLIEVTSGRIIHLRKSLQNMRRLRCMGNANDMVSNHINLP